MVHQSFRVCIYLNGCRFGFTVISQVYLPISTVQWLFYFQKMQFTIISTRTNNLLFLYISPQGSLSQEKSSVVWSLRHLRLRVYFLIKGTGQFSIFNFVMEEKNRAKDGPLLTLDPCISNLEDPSISSPLQKPIRRLKRDALKEKKKAKAAESKVVQSEELETDNVSSKPKQDEVGSVTSKDSCDGSDKLVRQRAEIATALIPKLIIKPPYVALASSNQIVGSFGHASAIFKKPIIQGHYFMEFTIKQDSKKEKPTTYPSAVRVGACIHSFDTAYPLGCNQSIGYKSSDGSIVRQNEVIGKAEPYSVGDVIGICLRIRPRRKHENEKEVDLGSKAQFYKNGKLVFEYKQLRQVFYCFGISVYNYSQVKIEDCQEGLFKIEGASHYLTSLQEKIPYRDLLGNKLFKV